MVVVLLIKPIECFHSRGQHLCEFIGTKENVWIRKEFNSHRTGLGHHHGRRFIVLGLQYGRRDVMWIHSIASFTFSSPSPSPSPSSLLKFPIVFCTPMWSTWRHVKPFYILCWRRCWFYFYYFSHLRCIVVKHSWWSGEITGRIGVHAAFTSSGSRRNRRDHGENQSWLGKIHLI